LARLRPGDLLVVDEAGMLDQDTARALLTVADESRARVALLGDRRQLAAVGRGGVLDLAVGQVAPAAHLILQGVHRFTRTAPTGETAPDVGYADLTLAMRTGEAPGAVFDGLFARGQVRLHPDGAALQETLAAAAATHHGRGEPVAVVVDTGEQVAELNAAVRSRLVADGRVDDARVAVTRAGERIGVGDRIVTRRNDPDLAVANRDAWVVTGVGRHGGLLVTPADVPPPGVEPDDVTPAGTSPRVLPAAYVAAHVQLAYASTAHGAQGDTVAAAHVVVGERSGAASAYVGMTRGRTANTAHLIATDPAQAREQWIAVFARDRADLGPGHAAELARVEAARYAEPRPLEEVLADLHSAWTAEQRCRDRLAFWEPQRDTLRRVVALGAGHAGELAQRETDCRQTALAAERAIHRAEASDAAIAAEADRIRDTLLAGFDGEREAARAAARVVLDGPGRLGLRRAAVTRAGRQLTSWADRWRPHLPDLPNDPNRIARAAGWFDDRPALWRAFDTAGRGTAEREHPEHAQLRAAADAARRAHDDARRALAEAHRRRDERFDPFGPIGWAPDPEARLADLERDIAATHQELTDVRARIPRLTAEPALLALPAGQLVEERERWRAGRGAQRTAGRAAPAPASSPRPGGSVRPPEPVVGRTPRPGAGIGR
jgi:exodeoxyribonuclease V alpha subunit